jgi:ribonuclease R
LHKAANTDVAHIVNEIVLRSQAQAVYSPENEGHFGLGLQKYAHFTSPIRRYADLIVHRSMVRAYGFGEGGLDDGEEARLAEIADSISKSERLSMEAERSCIDRFTASWMAEHAGNSYDARISGVSRFGLFVRLNENGAEGLVPIRSLPNDYYIHDEQQHALIGRRNRVVFRLCAPVRVRIVQADRLTGSATFEVLNAENGADIPGFKPQKNNYRNGKFAGRMGGKGKPSGKSGGKPSGGPKGGKGPKKPRKKTTPKHKKKAPPHKGS